MGWINDYTQKEGPDILRSKGILAFKGEPKRFVFQGVHMILDGDLQRDWRADEKRTSRIVFIGRHLKGDEIRQGFMACAALDRLSFRRGHLAAGSRIGEDDVSRQGCDRVGYDDDGLFRHRRGADAKRAMPGDGRRRPAAGPPRRDRCRDPAGTRADGLGDFILTSCRFDLRSLARVRRPARPEPVVSNFPFDLDKEYLSRSPGHGTVESFDTIVSYTPDPGFAGVDTFTIDLAGVKAGQLGPTRVNFVVSYDGPPLIPGVTLR